MNDSKEQITIKKLRETGRVILAENTDYSVAALETDLLLAKVIGEGRLFLELNPYRTVLNRQSEQFIELLNRRKSGCPVAYLLGHKEFMGYDFYVNESVLIPRNDTEVVIELASEAIEKFEYRRISGLEIGVGTGIIGLNLLSKFRRLILTGCDINPDAVELSRKNALYLDNQLFDDGLDMEITERYEVYSSDLFSSLDFQDEELDFIISNPPYIPSQIIETLNTDVKDFEPRNALDGGEDGLNFYRRILTDGLPLVRTGGFFAFEIGYDQGDALFEMMEEIGLSDIKIQKDLAGNDRAIIGYKKIGE